MRASKISRRRNWVLGWAAIAPLLFCALAVPASADPSAFDTAKKYFDEHIGWEPLRARAISLEQIAQTKDERAIAMMRSHYFKPHAVWPIQEKYLNAASLEHFTGAKLGALDINDWVEATGKTPDYWLEFNAYRVHAAQITPERLCTIVKDRRANIFRRSAALQAIAIQGKIEAAVILPDLLDFSAQNIDRDDQTLWMAACCSALVYLSDLHLKDKKPDMIPAAEAVINLLTNKKISAEQRLLVVRHLAAFFKIDRSWMTADPWLMVLKGQMVVDDDSGATSARPSFMGLEIRGKHPVFVIDLSDSMLINLTDEEKNQLRGPITEGPKDKPRKGKQEKKDPLANLPWDQIKTRFDAARECLKICLKGLTKDMTFAVIRFGNKAEPMASTPKMLPVTPANIDLCIKELDAIKAGAANDSRKNGTLMGQTNLHGGLVRAFRMSDQGLITTEDEHINRSCLDTGTDAIIVLTDGSPTVDDYTGIGPEVDVPAQPATTYTYKDPETGEEHTVHQPEREAYKTKISMIGPFTQLDPYYRRDLLRMNLFRRADISVIGVGEYNAGWLNETARAGGGRVRAIGKGDVKK